MTKIGTYIVGNPNLTPTQRIKKIKEAGFETICVGINQLLDPSIPECASALSLEIENAHLSGKNTNYMWVDGLAGDEIADRYCSEIAKCAERGVMAGVAHVTWGVQTPPPVSQIGLDRFSRLAECAQKHDFKLALENSVSPTHLRFILDRVDSEHVGFCYDSGHHNCFAPKEDYLSDYGERLFAMHLQDNNGLRDLHMILGDGSAPFEQVLQKLRKTPLYKKSITMEVAGRIRKECPDKTAKEIEKDLSSIAILGTDLVKIYDGGFEIYGNLSYGEYLERLFLAGLKIAGRN